MSLQGPHALLNEMRIKFVFVHTTFRKKESLFFYAESPMNYLSRSSRPDFERVVIRSRNDAVSAKL